MTFAIAPELARLPARHGYGPEIFDAMDRAVVRLSDKDLRGSMVHSFTGAISTVGAALAAMVNFDTISLTATLIAGGLAALATGTAVAGGIAHRRVNRATTEANRVELDILEQRAASANGVERALAVLAAKQVRGMLVVDSSLDNPIEVLGRRFTVRCKDFDIVKRLDKVIALEETCGADDLARATSIMNIACSAYSTAAVEKIIASLEKLPPDARACLRELIADKVCKLLDAEGGNALRRQRFLEAFEGKRTPYLDHAVEQPALDHVLEPGIAKGSKQPVRTLGAALLVAQRELDKHAAITIDVATLDLAKQTAHYLEQKGFRAAIREVEPGRVVIAVYEADSAPAGMFHR